MNENANLIGCIGVVMDRVEKALAEFGYAKPNILELDISDTGKKAFAIEIDENTRYELWGHFKNLTSELQMYPIVSATWGSGALSWAENVKCEDVFSRFYYEEEAPDKNVSPVSIIALSESTSYESVLDKHNRVYSRDIVDSTAYYIDGLKRLFGKAPSEQEILDQMSSGRIGDYFDLNKWFFDWSVKEIGVERLSRESAAFLDWYEPVGQRELLLLLPTLNSWEAIAYMHWYGACSTTTEKAISLLRKWNAKYGAEIVAHYGIMLHLVVSRRPSTTGEAFELAKEQESLAPYTTVLSGATLSDLAIALMTRDNWFLHERP